MPNHITNIITFQAKEEELREALKGENGAVDFNSIIAMPTALKGTESPCRLDKAEQKELMNRYGATDWYDWSIKNWGTKWNAYRILDEQGLIEFETAWSTPSPIFEKLAKTIKGCKFTVEYADEDIGRNCGTFTCSYEDGCELEYPEDSEEFAYRIKGYDPDDLDEEEEPTPPKPKCKHPLLKDNN